MQKYVLQTSFTTQRSVVFVFVFMHVLQWEDTPETKGDILYIYIYIYIYKREKKTERRKDTEANIEKGKGLNHICAVM